MSSPTQGDIGPEQIPSNIYKQGALDSPELLQSQVELVLPAIRRELLQHDGRRNGPGIERGDQTHHLAPVLAHHVDLDPPSHQRLQIRIATGRLDASQLAVGQVA